ncbi:hypothetical protein POM88_054596 [Heracleum sosnowskyi]|uniref:Uncharacterized protein n=1 Tax=Heracleum sosnowskyi TaxID=360622 RepID=A0AAD8LWW2_9APIA|nr:hypothetical protein POM88_055095 [Heracleum sosnowskyi]KAK1350675.1 hypothetical protein POM88_054596 [Heracleum sosnowskyi]
MLFSLLHHHSVSGGNCVQRISTEIPGIHNGMALLISSAILSVHEGIYLPCYDIFRNSLEEFTSSNTPSLTPYAPLAAGAVARSLACINTCYPIELARTRMQVWDTMIIESYLKTVYVQCADAELDKKVDEKIGRFIDKVDGLGRFAGRM